MKIKPTSVIFWSFILSALTLTSCELFDNNDHNDGKPPYIPATKIELVATSPDQWTGVAISKTDRLFVNYPNWREGVKFSVGEVEDSTTVKPYPNAEWNQWTEGSDPAAHFICVQSVFVDNNNMLWVLDPANPQRAGEYLGVVPGGAKLVKIDLESNSVAQVIVFKEPVIKKNSYLNDVRIDEDKHIAYMTDSNEGAIIVVDLSTGEARRLLSQDPSTKSENDVLVVEGREVRNDQGELVNFHSDGIALNPSRTYLYWRAINATSFYRVSTSLLNDTNVPDSTLSKGVERLRDLAPADGMIFGNDGLLYLTSIEQNGVIAYDENNRNAQLVVQSTDLKWPDSFAAGTDGFIYVTTSQIHIKDPDQPYKIFKFASVRGEGKN